MHQKKLYGTATVGTKGQIVIPADAREALEIKAGDRFYVIGSPEMQAVTFIKEDQVEEFLEHINAKVAQFQELHTKTKKTKE